MEFNFRMILLVPCCMLQVPDTIFKAFHRTKPAKINLLEHNLIDLLKEINYVESFCYFQFKSTAT